MSSSNRSRSVLTHGWFAVTYWSITAILLAVIVLAFTLGSAQDRVATGFAVFGGVVLLSIGRFMMAKRQRDENKSR